MITFEERANVILLAYGLCDRTNEEKNTSQIERQGFVLMNIYETYTADCLK